MKRLLMIVLAALWMTSNSASATTTLTINVSAFTGGTLPGSSIRIDLENCANARVAGTGQVVPQTQTVYPVAGISVVTLFSNTDGTGGGQILCQTPTGQQAVSYYSFYFIYQGNTSSIGSYNLIPGTFNLIDLTPCVGPACIGSGSGGVTRLVAGTGIGINPTNGLGQVTVTNTGVTQIIPGANITVTPSGGNGAVTVSSIGGGGAGNPSAPNGTTQYSNATSNQFIAAGSVMTDAFNTGNNGISTSISNCVYFNCSLQTPSTSTDTEQSQMQAPSTTVPSVNLQDSRYNSYGDFKTWPMPNSFTGYQFQESNTHAVGYTVPNPSFLQGGDQGAYNEFDVFAAPGFSYGAAGCPLHCPGGQQAISSISRTGNIVTVVTSTPLYPQTGQPIVVAGVTDTTFNTSGNVLAALSSTSFTYSNSGANASSSGGTATTHTTIGDWSTATSENRLYYFATAGIRGGTTQTFCTGIGDCIGKYDYFYVAGGFEAPSDEGENIHSTHVKTPASWQGTITSLTDAFHTVATPTAGNALQGNGRWLADVSQQWANLQQMSLSYGPGNVHSPHPEVAIIQFDFNAEAIAITNIVGNGTTAVATYPNTTLQSPGVGSHVIITGNSISGFNTTVVVTAFTSTTFTFASTTSGTGTGGSAVTTLVPSYAQGTLVSNCVVPVQQGTVASTTCTVHSTTSPFTVSGGSAPDGHGLFCAAENGEGNMIFGGQITAVTAPDGSGNQVITVLANRSVPAFGLSSVQSLAYQGGGCGTVVNLNADTNSGSAGYGFIMASSYPVIATLDSHTIGYALYFSSQQWSAGPTGGSQAKTEALALDANASLAGGSYAMTNVARVGGVLTMTFPSNAGPVADAIINQNNILISGCSDSSVNGTQPHAFTSTTSAIYSLAQTGSNTTCSGGATVTLPYNYLQASIYPAQQVYDVADHTPGVQPISTLNNGHFAGSYQPYFNVGDALVMPMHPALSVASERDSVEVLEPAQVATVVHDLTCSNYCAVSGYALGIHMNPTSVTNLVGAGGDQFPGAGIEVSGYTNVGINFDNQPSHSGAVINVVGNSPYPSGLQNWDFLRVDGINALHWNNPLQQWSFQLNQTDDLIINAQDVNSTLPVFAPSLAFTTSGYPNYSNIQTVQFHDPATSQSSGTMGYDLYLGIFPFPTVTVNTTGTSQYNYQLEVLTPGGSTWSQVTVIRNGAATPNNTIACTLIPQFSGYSANVWVINGSSFYNLGSCTFATTVTDTGTRTSPTVGLNPFSVGGTLYFGSTVVNGAGQGSCWSQVSPFSTFPGTFPISQCISEPSAGIYSFDTTTAGNAAATIKAAAINVTGTTFPISRGVSTNTDLGGKITLASGVGTYTFTSTGITSAPVCVATDTTAVAATQVTTSTTTLTLHGTGSDVLNYVCIGSN